MDTESGEPVIEGAPFEPRTVWRWFRLVGVPLIALVIIATAIVLLRAPSSNPGSSAGGNAADAGSEAVPLDLTGVDATDGMKAAPGVGAPAPDFVLQSADGTAYRLSELRGHAVLVNFWATWCGPCKSEMPAIEQAYRERAGDGLVVLAVNVREGAGAVQPYVTKLGLTFPILLDQSGTVSRRYRVNALPTTFLINRDGTIDGMRIGPYTRAMLLARVDQLLSGD